MTQAPKTIYLKDYTLPAYRIYRFWSARYILSYNPSGIDVRTVRIIRRRRRNAIGTVRTVPVRWPASSTYLFSRGPIVSPTRLPIPEANYERFMTDKAFAKRQLDELYAPHPELFPAFDRGYALFGLTELSRKQRRRCRRLR